MHNALYTIFFLIILVLSISAAAIVLALVARHTRGNEKQWPGSQSLRALRHERTSSQKDVNFDQKQQKRCSSSSAT